MKKVYMTPKTRVASPIFTCGMIATSNQPDGDAYVDYGGPNSPTKDEYEQSNQPIGTIEGGEALGKRRFYTGY